MEWSYSLYENMRLCRSNHVMSSFYDILTGKVSNPQPNPTPRPRHPRWDRQQAREAFLCRAASPPIPPPGKLHLLLRIKVNTRERNPVHARHGRLLLLPTELLEDLISPKHFGHIVSALSDERLSICNTSTRTSLSLSRSFLTHDLSLCSL